MVHSVQRVQHHGDIVLKELVNKIVITDVGVVGVHGAGVREIVVQEHVQELNEILGQIIRIITGKED